MFRFLLLLFVVLPSAAGAATLTLTQDQVAAFQPVDTLSTFTVYSVPAGDAGSFNQPYVQFAANTPVATSEGFLGSTTNLFSRARIGLSGLADLSSYDAFSVYHQGLNNPYGAYTTETRLVAIDVGGNVLSTVGGSLSTSISGFNWSAVVFLGIDILQLYSENGSLAVARVTQLSSGSTYTTDAELFSAVPVPASAWFLATGLIGLAAGALRARRRTV